MTDMLFDKLVVCFTSFPYPFFLFIFGRVVGGGISVTHYVTIRHLRGRQPPERVKRVNKSISPSPDPMAF